jgi:hypothetical protein
MRPHINGIALLYFILGYAGTLCTLFESSYLFFKLFALAFACLLTYQLLTQINNEN